MQAMQPETPIEGVLPKGCARVAQCSDVRGPPHTAANGFRRTILYRAATNGQI